MNDQFNIRFNNISHEIWLKITQIESLKGKWDGSTKLSPQILGRLKKSVLVTSTGASTRIEGSKLTDETVEKMMKGISIQKFSNRDEQEVMGYYELLQNIFNSWESITFSESAILHFHKELLKYVGKDETHRGEYKKKKMQYIWLMKREISGNSFETTKAYLTQRKCMSSLIGQKQH